MRQPCSPAPDSKGRQPTVLPVRVRDEVSDRSQSTLRSLDLIWCIGAKCDRVPPMSSKRHQSAGRLSPIPFVVILFSVADEIFAWAGGAEET